MPPSRRIEQLEQEAPSARAAIEAPSPLPAAVDFSAPLGPAGVLGLQQRVGNAAVARGLARQATATATAAATPGTGGGPVIEKVTADSVMLVDATGERRMPTFAEFAREFAPGDTTNPRVAGASAAYKKQWREIVTSAGIPVKGDMAAPDAGLSVELADAPNPEGATSADRVLLWLEKHKDAIEAAEKDFGIDRRAIAGAIAWEALENVRSEAERTFGRFVGPGKVHIKEDRFPPAAFGTGEPVAEEVEKAGILPKQTLSKREKLLGTPEGSIRYVGGTMKLGADIATAHGFDISGDPKMLTFFFVAMDSAKWTARLKAKKPGDKLDTTERMPTWVTENLLFIEKAVGKSALGAAPAAAAPSGPAPDKAPDDAMRKRADAIARLAAELASRNDDSGPASITVTLIRKGDELSWSLETQDKPHFDRPSSRSAMTPNRTYADLKTFIEPWLAKSGTLRAVWTRDGEGFMNFSASTGPVETTAAPAGTGTIARSARRLSRQATPPTTESKPAADAPPDPAADAKKLAEETPTSDVDYATWLLKATDQGFASLWTNTKAELEAFRDGKKTDEGVEPSKTELKSRALKTMYDIVKGPMSRWIAAPKEAKKPIVLGSFLRDATGLHGGSAIDVPRSMEAGTVDDVITMLGDLSPAKYGLGLPFSGDYFDPADALDAKQAAAIAKAGDKGTPAKVSGAIKLDTSHIYEADWDAEAKKYKEPTIESAGQAYTKLKSEALKQQLKKMRDGGSTLTIFPDRKGHVHIDQR